MKMNPIGFDNSSGLVALATIAFISAGSALGCIDCREEILDRSEERLREDPQRSGKVGTLVGLEVARAAREVASAAVISDDKSCDIGWRIDEPFSLSFLVEIEVDRQGWHRRWTEEGIWRRDDSDRWMIEGDVKFSEGQTLQGTRNYRVMADEKGFWEWIGADVVVRHERAGDMQRYWKEEFGRRFANFLALSSNRDQRVRGCGPMEASDLSGWRPLLMARADEKQLEVTITGEQKGRDLCRQAEAGYALGGQGVMTVRLRECHRQGSMPLSRSREERIVEPERRQSPSSIVEELEDWIDEGLVVRE